MAHFYDLKIQQIIKETSEAVAISFDIPSNLKDAFFFKPGQYITLKTTIENVEVRRSYSLCSLPNRETMTIVVKAIPNGLFSNYAVNNLKEGDTVEVSNPEGTFILLPENNKNYIAFVAGSGITPVLSMILSVLETEATSKFTLVYGNKTAEDTIFYGFLNDLQKKFPNRLKVHYVFSREQKDGALNGRIDAKIVDKITKKNPFDAAYLCGPEEMINTVSETLLKGDFKKDTIHYELFTVSEDKEKVAQVKDGETNVKVVLDDEEVSFTMSQKESILAATLHNKLDAPYSCQGGVCSTCICRIVEGKAIMTKNTVLSEEEVDEGLVLSCQAYPVTSEIIVDFDDV